MRHYLFLLIAISSGSIGVAQQLKYKELAPLLQESSQQEQMAMLRDYMVYDQEEPNVDFRLGKLHYSVFRNSDPLVQYAKAMANAHEASLRLTRAKLLVTESEVRRNNEYYAPLFKTVDSKGRPYVEFFAVQKSMQDAYDSVMKFKSEMPAIYRAFTNAVNQYGLAVKIFAKINSQHRSLEDMLLLLDDDLMQELDLLKISYDSSVVYFDQYLTLIKNYPLPKYQQKYQVKPIQIYHLDGLTTSTNFLANEITFWNYSAWVDDVYRMHKEVIIPLKEKLEQNELKLSQRLNEIETQTVSENSLHKLEKDLVFNLNNYDKNSLVLELLRYKAFTQHWNLKKKTIGSDTTVDRKLELYSHLIRQNREADSLYQRTKLLLNPHNITKHRLFLTKHYGGEQGLKEFLRTQENMIASSYSQYRQVLKENLTLSSGPAIDTTKFIKISALQIPLFTPMKQIRQSAITQPVTLKQTKNPDGSMYLAGIHKMNKKNLNGRVFIARINPDGKPAWFKDFTFKPDSLTTTYDIILGDIVSTQEGCAVIISSYANETSAISNTFLFLNEKGEEKIYPVKEAKIARRILYQERSNSFIIAFKGINENEDIQADEPISVISMNILGDLNWRRDLPLSGTLQDMISVRDGYILAGNYTAMADESGKQLKTKVVSGQANPYLIKLNLKGDVVTSRPFVSTKSIVIKSVVKVNDESINLVGFEGSFALDNASSEKNVHMMTDYNLKTICSDF